MITDHLHLDFVVTGIDQIQDFVAGCQNPESSEIVQAAVLHKIHRITHSAIALSKGFKERHPEIDWRSLLAFRNIVNRVDIDFVCVTHALEHSLPVLKLAAVAEIARLSEKP